MKKFAIISVSLTVIIAAVATVLIINSGLFDSESAVQHVKDKTISPVYGSIADTTIASGMVKNNAEYTVTSPVSARVLECNIAEGDTVTAGSVIYRLEDSAIQRQISQQKVALEGAKTTLSQQQAMENDLIVKSSYSGIVTKVYINNGDMVQPGAKIMDVVDSRTMVLKLPFNASDAGNVAVGTQLSVVLIGSGIECPGTVVKVHEGTSTYSGNRVGIMTEINVANPGAINKGDKAMAVIGQIASLSDGTFEYLTEKTITSATSGQVVQVSKTEGSTISVGEEAAELKNDTIKNTIENAAMQIKSVETTINNLNQQLNDYIVKAPTDGTVKKLIVKRGEQGQGQLAVIADNSGLYVDAEIDETTISKVKPDQQVNVKSASGDREYTGRVVSIDTNGIQKNGDTFYNVKIIIDENEELMAGMNVDLEIISSVKQNALLLPRNAVTANTVKVVTDDGVITKTVKTGLKNNELIEILEGLTTEDQVVSENQKQL